ncbi:hypothetical protein Mpe_B0091 (plasmid) [Methylibium petroleiphilum PM1]|uniref:Uncharacterized protein n=1 Tax=Methylibium petroleiphilum (strain ATCC BAA-1232 / LMG 22953 / PM1) TaxID=420662 RepID=A2SMT1_METPP|nr:hypothetical protein Mpe_B0091 [Methylibium petroleiphilum PM1]
MLLWGWLDLPNEMRHTGKEETLQDMVLEGSSSAKQGFESGFRSQPAEVVRKANDRTAEDVAGDGDSAEDEGHLGAPEGLGDVQRSLRWPVPLVIENMGL